MPRWPQRTIEERFWSKTRAEPGPLETECWVWTAAKSCGYGRIGINDHYQYAHRFSWQIANGPIPDGLQVLHHCDVRACVRPDHLFIGTQLRNIEDMVSKGRQAKGLEHRVKTSRGRRNKSSKYPGVYRNQQRQKWQASAMRNGKDHFLGYFDREEDAARAYGAFVGRLP